uniref:Uncharacterized protein n=1 Tax=Arundo donax TaxID=35708 RepID=A0A0A9C3P4_ARUDO
MHSRLLNTYTRMFSMSQQSTSRI